MVKMDNRESVNIAKIFLSYRGYVKGVALQYAPHPQWVDDIVQQVFAILIQKADQWTIEDDPKALLRVLARNTANQLWREKIKESPETIQKIGEFLKSITQNEPEPEYEGDLKRLRACLELLPIKNRQLLDMHYGEGVSMKTIAQRFDKKSTTISHAICRLRSKLRECVENRRKKEGFHG